MRTLFVGNRMTGKRALYLTHNRPWQRSRKTWSDADLRACLDRPALTFDELDRPDRARRLCEPVIRRSSACRVAIGRARWSAWRHAVAGVAPERAQLEANDTKGTARKLLQENACNPVFGAHNPQMEPISAGTTLHATVVSRRVMTCICHLIGGVWRSASLLPRTIICLGGQ